MCLYRLQDFSTALQFNPFLIIFDAACGSQEEYFCWAYMGKQGDAVWETAWSISVAEARLSCRRVQSFPENSEMRKLCFLRYGN